MDLYRAKLVTTVLAAGLVIGGLVGGIFYYVFPQHFPHWFEGILAFFLVTEAIAVAFVETMSRKVDQRKLLNSYLLVKVAKFLLALIFVGAYALIVKEGMKSFILVFMLFYLLFLLVETRIFAGIEKRLKKKD